MDRERWLKVEKLYDAARERPAGERERFLMNACAGDETLRHELESLLAQHEATGSFMDLPAIDVAPRSPEQARGEELDARTDIFSQDAYIHDFERDTTTRLTNMGNGQVPVWAPDGKHLALQSVANDFKLYWMRSDVAGKPQSLLEGTNNLVPWSMSPDGRRLAYFQHGATAYDLWTLPLDLTDPDHPKPGKPELYLQTPWDKRVPRFSPDGR